MGPAQMFCRRWKNSTFDYHWKDSQLTHETFGPSEKYVWIISLAVHSKKKMAHCTVPPLHVRGAMGSRCVWAQVRASIDTVATVQTSAPTRIYSVAYFPASLLLYYKFKLAACHLPINFSYMLLAVPTKQFTLV